MQQKASFRRTVALVFLALALILGVGVAVYVYSARQQIFSKNPSQPALFSAATPQPSCTTPSHAAGDHIDTIVSSGVQRSLLVHLPPSYGQHPQPLVVSYHGYSWTVQNMEHNTQTASEADKAGFVLVFPQGLDSPPTWNAGVGAYGPTGAADDIQFTRDLFSYMQKQYCIDTQRIYVTGFSLGGGMAYRVACRLSNQIAALATVSGAYYPLPEGCHPARPLPVLEIHGAADTQAPYAGNPTRHMAGVQDYLNIWLDIDKCDHTSHAFFQQGDVTGREWTRCAPGVTVKHYRISDGGHSWPGTPNTTHVINANEVIWQFFSNYRLPAAAK
ncbi:MAG: dienelactone hydrolase family protein [Ktedonobacteraceae bacterium]|nr:dienelactone hydrolase family protein [Ktedonobacteraceae bacterium]